MKEEPQTVLDPLGQPRKIRAQEKYAQQMIDYIWDNVEELVESGQAIMNKDGFFLKAGIHSFVRGLIPQAQPGDVVNVLRRSGCIEQAAQGLWEIHRRNVLMDDEGNPIEYEAPKFGHATQIEQSGRMFQDYNKRLTELEERMDVLTAIVIDQSERGGKGGKESHPHEDT